MATSISARRVPSRSWPWIGAATLSIAARFPRPLRLAIVSVGSPPDVACKKILEQKFSLTLCGPTLPQAAFADFLSSGGYDNHLRRMRRAFESNIAHMIRTVEMTFPPGTRVTRPAGGFVLWVELPKPLASRSLFNEALDEGICFAPGDVFSASGRYGNCLRLSCGHSWDARIENGLMKLGELASKGLARRRDRRPQARRRPTI